jgi:Tfp pilus assembly protein PilF
MTPPDWFHPVRETLGGILLRNKEFEEAEKVFRQDLSHHPRNGRALFGLWKSLKNPSKHADAFWVKEEFNQAWQYSDTPLSVDQL